MRNRNESVRVVSQKSILAMAAVAALGTAVPAMADITINSNGPKLTLQPGVGPVGSFTSMMDDVNNLGVMNAITSRTFSADGTRGTATSSVAINRTYVGAAGGLFSTASNWNPAGTPLATDNLTFGASPAGSYAVTNDLASTVLGDLVFAPGAGVTPAAKTVTLNGGYNGNRIEIQTGGLVLNGGTSTITSEFTSNYAMRVGVGSGQTGAITINNGAKLNYNDFLYGAVGGTGNVTITGAGTELIPFATGVNIESDFRGGGSGSGNILIDQGAKVTANFHLSNNVENFTVSNGATYIAPNYQGTVVNEDNETVTQNYGGAMNFGYFSPPASGVTPSATFNVTSGATVTSTFVNMAGAYAGTNATLNVTGATVNAGLLELSDPIPRLINGSVATNLAANVNIPTTFNKSTGTIGAGGIVNAGDVVMATADTTKATLNVAGGQLNVDGVVLMGGTTGDIGAGSSDLNVTAGGTISARQVNLGTIVATSAAPTYSGNNIVVDGANSKITVIGVPATSTAAAFGANMFVGAGEARKSSVTISNGGNITLKSDATDSNEDGTLIVGASNSVSNITVDGVNSTFEAGTQVNVFFTSAAVTNATANFNIKNGGYFHTTFVNSNDQGDVLLGVFAGAGSAINVNIGGGTGTADSSSAFYGEGIVYVGGNGGFGSAITTGVTTTVNINNGEFDGGLVAVYPNSTINVNKGALTSDSSISLSGGIVKMSTTGAAADAVMLADTYEVESGGYFDIGKHGGVSVVGTYTGSTETSTTELAEIKALIVSGGIRSSLVTSLGAGKYGIGYAPRLPGSTVASFLGVTLGATDNAVLFRTTLRGDADLSGNVNFDDLITLAKNYNGTSKAWYQGDFTYDGTVNFDDLIFLAQNYNQAVPASLTAEFGSAFANDWTFALSLVPEPTSLSVLAGAGIVALKRRRR